MSQILKKRICRKFKNLNIRIFNITKKNSEKRRNPKILYRESELLLVGWSDLAFFRFYHMLVFHELDLLVLRPF